MASIIIPAHNEAAVIAGTLESLLDSVGEKSVEVIVVCNGCTDDTAERARAFLPAVTVVETEVASKTHALNLGDVHAHSFPRIYLDADIQVSESFVTEMAQALQTDDVRAAWPSVHFDMAECSWAVRAFYHVWTALPYNQPGRIGVGTYGLSEAARGQFSSFPDVISDDGYIRGLFGDQQRILLRTCQTIVQAPLTLESLVKVQTRTRLGIYELQRKQPTVLQGHRTRTTLWDTLRVLVRPAVAWRFPIYLYVNIVSRMRANRQLRGTSDVYRWERDDSTRTIDDPQQSTTCESAHT